MLLVPTISAFFLGRMLTERTTMVNKTIEKD
jgi:hypothetical protein